MFMIRADKEEQEMKSQIFRAKERGAMLLLMMVMIVVMGLAAGMAGQSWRATMQRANEAELLWRGEQYQRAISSYFSVKHGGSLQMLPTDLEQLVSDPRFATEVRHIRKLYKDPMTGEDWELIKDPAERILGVRSKSTWEPFKKDGFSKDLESLAGKTAYNEWEFVFRAPRATSPVKPISTARQLNP
jgi:type II secretory pathway pseudopilin PulG